MKIIIAKKILEIVDKGEALELKEKLQILKRLNDQENIFLDFTAESKLGLFGKKKYKFKIYYRFESNLNYDDNSKWSFLKKFFNRLLK